MLVSAPVTAPSFSVLLLEPVEQLVRRLAVAAVEQDVRRSATKYGSFPPADFSFERLGLQRRDLLRRSSFSASSGSLSTSAQTM